MASMFYCFVANSQVPQVVCPFTKFDDLYFSNQDHSSVYFYTSSADPFVLKKVNTLGGLTTVFSKPIPSNAFYVEDIDMFQNKGIARLALMSSGDSIFKFWLYNGVNVDAIDLDFIRNGFDPAPKPVLNSNIAYIFDEKRIYKSDYTSIGTSIFFTSPLHLKLTSQPILLAENSNTVVWVDNGNYPSDTLLTPRRFHLYTHQGGITTMIDSSMDSYYIVKKDAITNDVYAFKINTSTNQPNTFIYKFTSSGIMSVDSNLHFIPVDIVGGKVIGERLTSGGAYIGFGAFNVDSDSMNVFPYLNSLKLTQNVVSNGNACYFLADQFATLTYKPYYTNGDTLINLSTNPYSGQSNWKERGAFCGDNFWANKYYTTGFTFAIDSFKEQYTPQGINSPFHTPNDTVDYSFDIVSDGQYIYYSGYHSDNISFPSTFYRLECGAALNSSISNLSQDDIQLYPIPASDYLFVRNLKNDMSIASIIDMTGKFIKTINLQNGINTISLNSLQSGIYMLQGKNWSKKFVKE